MARTTINFFRSDVDDLYDDSYASYIHDVWVSYNDAAEDESSEYARKWEFVRALSRLYDEFNISAVGYEQCFTMEYIRNQKDPQNHDEYVLIWHEATMKNCTVIDVTADSLEAMQRDIMRAVMR